MTTPDLSREAPGILLHISFFYSICFPLLLLLLLSLSEFLLYFSSHLWFFYWAVEVLVLVVANPKALTFPSLVNHSGIMTQLLFVFFLSFGLLCVRVRAGHVAGSQWYVLVRFWKVPHDWMHYLCLHHSVSSSCGPTPKKMPSNLLLTHFVVVVVFDMEYCSW